MIHPVVTMRGAVVLMLLGAATACGPNEATVVPVSTPASSPSPEFRALLGEVQRLSERVATLEQQLSEEHRTAARVRQESIEQRERIAALENDAAHAASEPPPRAAVATTMQAEAELRLAYGALMRAIERLDISAEEKTALKNSLKPTRSLDRDNPWSVAKW